MTGEYFDSGGPERRWGQDSNPRRRRYLGVLFACCNVYARVYVNSGGTQYVGYCPRCARHVKFDIGPGGTNDRFFTAY